MAAAVQPPRLYLDALTAADLMTPNPVSIRAEASVREAIALLTDRDIGAAPVIDEAGHPLGVVSQSDILVHDRERIAPLGDTPDFYTRVELDHEWDGLPEGFEVEHVDRTTVREIMTPVVFAVSPDATTARVVEEMVQMRVHRLFVTDEDGALIGVISTMDLLKRLHA
jgi:CBS-domain-containing membrane protein